MTYRKLDDQSSKISSPVLFKDPRTRHHVWQTLFSMMDHECPSHSSPGCTHQSPRTRRRTKLARGHHDLTGGTSGREGLSLALLGMKWERAQAQRKPGRPEYLHTWTSNNRRFLARSSGLSAIVMMNSLYVDRENNAWKS